MLDWQFKENFEQFKSELINRVANESRKVDLDNEIEAFMKHQSRVDD